MDNKIKDAEELVNQMNIEDELMKSEELVKDNNIIFKHQDKIYKVSILNLIDKEELTEVRRKKFIQLLKDKDVILEKELIKIYKEKGLDIDNIDKDISIIESQKKSLQLKLGESLSKNESQVILTNYESEIKDLDNKRKVLLTQKTLLLEASLENQIEDYVSKYITYLALYIKEAEVFNKAFSNFEDFCKCIDEKLINKAGTYAIMLNSFKYGYL